MGILEVLLRILKLCNETLASVTSPGRVRMAVSYLFPQEGMLIPDALEQRVQRIKVGQRLQLVIEIVAKPGVSVVLARHCRLVDAGLSAPAAVAALIWPEYRMERLPRGNCRVWMKNGKRDDSETYRRSGYQWRGSLPRVDR